MSDPNGWEAEVLFAERVTGASTWKAAPQTENLVVPAAHSFRLGFRVANGIPGSPITQGNLMLQEWRTGDSAWRDTGYYGNGVDPGYATGGEFPVDVPPEWVFADLTFPDPIAWRYRARLEWVDGEHLSPEVLLIVAAGLLPGALAEFFTEGEEATMNAGEKRVLGILRAPFRTSLGVEGTAPALTVEAALVAEYPIGTPLTVGGAGFRIKGRKDAGPDLVELELEAA